THFGETKLVASSFLTPAAIKSLISVCLTEVGTVMDSFCRPSRGLTSTILTWSGYESFLLIVVFYAPFHSRFHLEISQECWDKFCEASGVRSAQQARKFIPAERYFKRTTFILNWLCYVISTSVTRLQSSQYRYAVTHHHQQPNHPRQIIILLPPHPSVQ